MQRKNTNGPGRTKPEPFSPDAAWFDHRSPQVGATIEDLDIHDLESALVADVDNQDIQFVYQNLTKGSRNHMRAFSSRLAAHDATYMAQYISAADDDAVVDSDWERGPVGEGQGQGRGKGQGRGRGHGKSHGRGCNNG